MRRCEDEKMRYRPPLLEEPCAQTLSGIIIENKIIIIIILIYTYIYLIYVWVIREITHLYPFVVLKKWYYVILRP